MKKAFWGLFFILAGVVVILNQLNIFTSINLFTLLITIFIIPIFLKSLFRLNFTGIFFSAAFMCIIYSGPLHLESITPWPVLFTALLASIGFSIIFGKHHFGHCNFEKSNFSDVIETDDNDDVKLNVNFGSSIKYVNSDNFKSANLYCSFGAMKVYFDNAKIEGDNAIVNIDASFAGLELYIPKEWTVINKIDATLGGIDEKNKSNFKTNKTLTLKGRISLSGIEIIYI